MSTTTNEKPTVLIVGAGLGGLMLGALLEKSGVPYNIFERAAAVKPLGMSVVNIKNNIEDNNNNFNRDLPRMMHTKTTIVHKKQTNLSSISQNCVLCICV